MGLSKETIGSGSLETRQATAFAGLGANLGDRESALRAAVAQLDEHKQIAVDFDTGVASLYESDPVGCDEPQPAYLNTVIRIDTTLAPHALLTVTSGIERRLGRTHDQRWEPRTIDVDLLLYGVIDDRFVARQDIDGGERSRGPAPRPLSEDRRRTGLAPRGASRVDGCWMVLATDTLTLPHPRLCERRFVLEPLAEIAPNLILPGARRTIAELAGRATSTLARQVVRRVKGPEWIRSAAPPPARPVAETNGRST